MKLQTHEEDKLNEEINNKRGEKIDKVIYSDYDIAEEILKIYE